MLRNVFWLVIAGICAVIFVRELNLGLTVPPAAPDQVSSVEETTVRRLPAPVLAPPWIPRPEDDRAPRTKQPPVHKAESSALKWSELHLASGSSDEDLRPAAQTSPEIRVEKAAQPGQSGSGGLRAPAQQPSQPRSAKPLHVRDRTGPRSTFAPPQGSEQEALGAALGAVGGVVGPTISEALGAVGGVVGRKPRGGRRKGAAAPALIEREAAADEEARTGRSESVSLGPHRPLPHRSAPEMGPGPETRREQHLEAIQSRKGTILFTHLRRAGGESSICAALADSHLERSREGSEGDTSTSYSLFPIFPWASQTSSSLPRSRSRPQARFSRITCLSL